MTRWGLVALGLSTLVTFGGCGSEDDEGSGASDRCWASEPGCLCGPDRPKDAASFPAGCDEEGVGEVGYCCQRDEYCRCQAVQCSFSAVDGMCICGLSARPGDEVVDSCTGQASTCCTQDTGYCYCEEGCEKRFGNRVVSSCDRTTDTVGCGDLWERVDSCQ